MIIDRINYSIEEKTTVELWKYIHKYDEKNKTSAALNGHKDFMCI